MRSCISKRPLKGWEGLEHEKATSSSTIERNSSQYLAESMYSVNITFAVGQIIISSIGDYVKKRVQDLTKGKQNPNLRGVNLEEDFTLSAAR